MAHLVATSNISLCQTEVRHTTNWRWLECQLYSEATRLYLISTRRRTSGPDWPAPPVAALRGDLYPRTVAGRRSQDQTANTRWPSQQRRYDEGNTQLQPAVLTAQQLVDCLGAVGWQCKSTPQARWLPDTAASMRSLAAALLPHTATLSSSDLAHCCWSLAQLGPIAAGDATVTAFIAAVQCELLAPTMPSAETPPTHDSSSSITDDSGSWVLERPLLEAGGEGAATSTSFHSTVTAAAATAAQGCGGRLPHSGSQTETTNQPSGGPPPAARLQQPPSTGACASVPDRGGVSANPSRPSIHGPGTPDGDPNCRSPSRPRSGHQQPGQPRQQAAPPGPPIHTRLATLAGKDLSKLAWSLAKLRGGAIGSGGDGVGPPGLDSHLTTGAPAAAAVAGRSSLVTDAGTSTGIASPAGGGGDDDDDVRRLRLRQLQDGWWQALGDAAAAAIQRSELPPQAVCTTLWAFALVGCRHSALQAAVAECIAEGHRTHHKPVGIANLWWAFVTLGFYPQNLRGRQPHARSDPILDPDSYPGPDRERTDDDPHLSPWDTLDALGPFEDLRAEAQGNWRGQGQQEEGVRQQAYGGGRLYDEETGFARSRTRTDDEGRGSGGDHTWRQRQQPRQRRRRQDGQPSADDAGGGGEQETLYDNITYDDLYDRLYNMLTRLALASVGAMSLQQMSNTAWAVVASGQYLRRRAARRLLGAIAARATELMAAGAAEVAAAAAARNADMAPLAGPGWEAHEGADDRAKAAAAGRPGRRRHGVTTGDEASATATAEAGVRHDPHAASVLAWALCGAARPGHPGCVAFLDAVAAAALTVPPGLVSYSDRDLAMVLAAHQRCRHFSPALMRGVREEVMRRAAGMYPRVLVDICYNLAMMNYYNEAMFEAIAASAARRLTQFGPALASRLVWSTAHVRHHSPPLLAAFCDYIRSHLVACGSLDLVSTASALAQLNHYDPGLFRELGAEVVRRTPPEGVERGLDGDLQGGASKGGSGGDGGGGAAAAPLGPRALVNLLWCCTVLSHVDEGLLEALLERLRREDIRRLDVPTVMQLFQSQVMLEDLYGGIIAAPKVLTKEQLRVALATWKRVSRGATTTSRLQGEVVAALRRLGCAPRCERVTRDGLFSIDTAVQWEGRRIAVEVDGPTHFTASRPHRPLGRTLAKRRCLELRGWRVLSVPGHEWWGLRGCPRAEERYLRGALEGVLWQTHVLDGVGLP